MQSQINGKVLTRESGIGIRDLVVVAVDFDRWPPQDPDSSSGTWHDLSELLDAQYEDDAVQRLGSVITDQHGRFELRFLDDLFRDPKKSDNERRPDIVLYVLAPDRAASSSGAGLSAKERILFHTRPIRFEAGRVESYVIHIDEERLLKLGIRHGQSSDDLDDLRRRVEGHRIARSDLTRLWRREFAAENKDRLRAERNAAPKLFRALLPAAGGRHIGINPSKSVIADAFRDLVNELLNWIVRDNSRDADGVLVRLDDAALRRLGVSARDFVVAGDKSISFELLLRSIGLPNGPSRIRDLFTGITARRAAHQLTSPIAPEDGGDDGGAGESAPTTADDVRETILDRLQAQVSSLPSSEAAEAAPVFDIRRIKEVVDSLEMSGGPANVAAIHQIQALQVAFEPAWVASFDQEFANDVRKLYREANQLDATYGLDLPDLGVVDDLNQFREFLAELTNSGEYAELEPVPPSVLRVAPWLTGALWNRLSDDPGKATVRRIVADLHEVDDEFSEDPSWGINDPARVASANEAIKEIVTSNLTQPLNRSEELAMNISSRLSQPYSFQYFAPGTINYGVLLTFNQSWTPITYQVGRLADAVALAPGETRSFKVMHSMKRTRRESSRQTRSLVRTTATESIGRAELEAIEKVAKSLSGRLSTHGGANIVGIANFGATTQFGFNQSQESQSLQKSFQELTQKTSEEVRQESEISIESNLESAISTEETREIRNGNQEITVTYLLYELERRFRVSSQLASVQPVLLVALDFPAPHDINDAWILEYAWIIREVLLSSDFEEAIDYVEQGQQAEQTQLELLRATYERLAKAADQAESEFERIAQLATRRRQTVVDLTEEQGVAGTEGTDAGGRAARAIFTGGLSELFGASGDSDREEIVKSRRKAAEKALEYVEKELAKVAEARERARGDLQHATDRLAEALVAKSEKETLVAQLLMHVRGNVHYYMQEIWLRQHPDQRYFGLYDLQAPFLAPSPDSCKLRPARPEEIDRGVPGIIIDGDPYVVSIDPPSPPPSFDDLEKPRLGEICELDRLLGFRGNYAVFPLKRWSHITNMMLIGFLDSYFGVRDPEAPNGYRTSELIEYAREIWNDPAVSLTEDDRARLAELINANALAHPVAETEVVLPTGHLFMEALKGNEALLESFKLAHRGLDVVNVEEGIRERRIDMLRRASRVANGDFDIDPQDVDKYVIVRGDGDTSIDA